MYECNPLIIKVSEHALKMSYVLQDTNIHNGRIVLCANETIQGGTLVGTMSCSVEAQ